MNQNKLKSDIRTLRKILQYNRVRILLLLSKKETCACELIKSLNIPNNLVSHHLKTLYDLNILNSRKIGLHRKYSIKKDHKKQICGLIKCFKSFSSNNEKKS